MHGQSPASQSTQLQGYFADALDIDDPNAIAALGLALGLDPGMMLAGIADPEIKALARRYGEEAVGRGVFGSPWISR